jgi:YVTN family beta-propeller protein
VIVPRNAKLVSLLIAVFVSCSVLARSARAQPTVLVLHKWSEDLGAYDAATGKPRGGRVRIGSIPHEMVLSRDQKRLYVTNYGVKRYTETASGGNTVSIVDLAKGEKIGEISLGDHRRPHGIALGRSGRLYVTADFPPSVLALDPRTRKLTSVYALDQQLPHMLAVSRDERTIYTANSGSGTVSIVRIDPKTKNGFSTTNVAVGGVPMGLALSPDGSRLFVANRQGNAVVVIDNAKAREHARVDLPGAPARVELLPGGNKLLVSLIDAGDVALLDASTLRVVERKHVGRQVEGMLVDHAGRRAWISAQGDDQVVELELPSLRRRLAFPTGSRPDPIVLLPSKLEFPQAAPAP